MEWPPCAVCGKDSDPPNFDGIPFWYSRLTHRKGHACQVTVWLSWEAAGAPSSHGLRYLVSEQVTFEQRTGRSREARYAYIWGKSVSGRGNSQGMCPKMEMFVIELSRCFQSVLSQRFVGNSDDLFRTTY